MLRPEAWSLRAATLARGTTGRFLADETVRIPLDRLGAGTALDTPAEALRGRSVLVTTRTQLPTVLAMLELDGIAARMLLCPPDLPAEHLDAIIAEAGVDAVVSDGTGLAIPARAGMVTVGCRSDLGRDAGSQPARTDDTEWVLFTSGTTGRPKMVRHTLDSLAGPLASGPPGPGGMVWSTFYDVRRYGGLSILMRALLLDASMVLSGTGEGVGGFLARAGAEGVTHISGTPSHWRRAMMSPAATAMAPQNVRMSGEIADQAILDRVQAVYPAAGVTHAFASTEAGVAFEVNDGLTGFPVSIFDGHGVKAEMRIVDGTLRIRSTRVAAGYVGTPFAAPAGFVDTGDLVERRGERCYFLGRREGVINVGGQKVYPEEVEAVINRHPMIRMSRVWPRLSPVTGAVVAADVVLEPDAEFGAVREDVLDLCRGALPPYKVPVSVRQVPSLAITESGKLLRRYA